ncbi:permease prefix domain 1-containing protein [Deinococcus arenicola]|uniref:Permease prefix domain 1-containing protein n=1 Tax=Deinococcus arenicola TaxID=2994950 RepID=A0ABU4DVP5_9DEIO|nr:permease prefix domain 1-containing protein [Deinococcus sp. ZS9-10]MDV6376496.1 permease prefix domain 1-containing protein [Deinococcus sp. ZS9-10]
MSATTLELSPAACAYLRRATWGLPRERQQEVWDELEEHLLTRAAQLQACGAAPPEALARALTELGSPARVSAGMTGVYLMPKLILMAGAGALALSAALYALAGGQETAYLPVVTNLPLPVCERMEPENVTGTIISNWANTVCFLPAASPKPLFVGGLSGSEPLVSLNTVERMIQLLDGKTRFQPNGVLEISLPASENIVRASFRVTTRFQGQAYFPAQVLIWPSSSKRQMLSGYQQPTLRIEQQVFAMSGNQGHQAGADFYNRLSPRLISTLGPGAYTTDGIIGARSHPIQTSLKADDVVLTVIHSHDNFYLTHYAPVSSTGSVNIRVNSTRLQFVSSFRQLKQKRADGRTPALLIRVTNVPLNNLKSSIFMPRQAISDAL